jgi:hypothetical protein
VIVPPLVFPGYMYQNISRSSQSLPTLVSQLVEQSNNGGAHRAQFQLQPIEGSSEKVNKVKILKKKLNETVYFYQTF